MPTEKAQRLIEFAKDQGFHQPKGRSAESKNGGETVLMHGTTGAVITVEHDTGRVNYVHDPYRPSLDRLA